MRLRLVADHARDIRLADAVSLQQTKGALKVQLLRLAAPPNCVSNG
jgi:hypothetical protein